MAELADSSRANSNPRNSGIRLRADVNGNPDHEAATRVIERLEDEIGRMGQLLEVQRSRYQRTLQAERDERKQLMRSRGKRTRRFVDEIETLREDNARLAEELEASRWAERRAVTSATQLEQELERAGAAYRASLTAL